MAAAITCLRAVHSGMASVQRQQSDSLQPHDCELLDVGKIPSAVPRPCGYSLDLYRREAGDFWI